MPRRYGKFSVENRTLEELIRAKDTFQKVAKRIQRFLDNEMGAQGSTAMSAQGDQDLQDLIEDITRIEDAIEAIQAQTTPEEELDDVIFAQTMANEARKTLNEQKDSPRKTKGEISDYYEKIRQLNNRDKELKQEDTRARSKILNRSFQMLGRDINNNLRLLDTSNDDELNRAEELDHSRMQVDRIAAGQLNVDEGRGEFRCRMFAEDGRGRCKATFANRGNRERHEKRVHPPNDYCLEEF